MEFFQDQILLINHLTISTQAVVKQVKKDIITVQTKKGIIPIENKVAILRKVDNKWRFAAIGKFV
jgi:translation initiation factor 2 gamma subunit (eIF-2gamma)